LQMKSTQQYESKSGLRSTLLLSVKTFVSKCKGE